MAQNVGIANVGRSVCNPLMIRNLDDVYRIECRKFLRPLSFYPISTQSNLLITNHLLSKL